jgi:hypothetical protein
VKQLNVPLEDEIYNEAKVASATAGMLLKDWVAKAIHECATPHITLTAIFPKLTCSVGTNEEKPAVEPEVSGVHPFIVGAARALADREEIIAAIAKPSPLLKSSARAVETDAPGELTIDPNQDFGA